MHTLFDGVNTAELDEDTTSYEQDIAKVAQYISRKEDPDYGLNEDELFESQKKKDKATARIEFAALSEASVEVNYPSGTKITFNGGNDSASFISSAVTLAQALEETEVNIWDIDNEIHTLSFEDAMQAAVEIGLEWRTQAYVKQAKLKEIEDRVK